MSKKLLILSTISAFLLTACGNSLQPKYEVIYHPMPIANETTPALESLKAVLEGRLATLKVKGSEVSIDNNSLVTRVDADVYDIGKASSIATQYNFSLQIQKDSLSDTEKAAVQKFNQGQKDILNKAYEQAKLNIQNIDTLVTSTSEKINQLSKGIRGPYRQAQVKEDAYWQALEKTAVGQLTNVVETHNAIWFAKVLEKDTSNPQHTVIKYQELFRSLKIAEPYLGYAPVLDLSQNVAKAEVVKKDPDSISNKNFAAKVTLTETGKKDLEKISQQYQGKNLRVFINNFPYATIKVTSPITDGMLMIDDDYNQPETERIVDLLAMPFLPAPLAVTSFKVL